MRTVTTLARTASDRELSPDVFVLEKRGRGRPVARYRVILNSREAVRIARRAGLPVSLLEPSLSGVLGYPISFRPRLLIDRGLLSAVESTEFDIIPFADGEAARHPTIEDVIVALLWIDPFGSRRILEGHRAEVDAYKLLKRILVEDAERLSTLVRLGELVPGLPTVGAAVPRVRGKAVGKAGPRVGSAARTVRRPARGTGGPRGRVRRPPKG